MNAYVAAGAAVVGIVVLEKTVLHRYVTVGQAAALKTFNAAGPELAPVISEATSHAVDAVGASVVCDLVLSAAHAGAFAVDPNSQGGETYNPLSSVRWFIGTSIDGGIAGGYLAELRESTWQGLTSMDGGDLSSFGSAVARVMRAKSALDGGDDSITNEALNACNALGVAMDNIGLLPGKPKDVTPLSWAGDELRSLLPSTSTLVIAGLVIGAGAYLAFKIGLLGVRV